MRKDGEEALRGHDPDPLPADVDQAVVLQFLERPGEGLRDGPQPGGEDVLPDRKIELCAVPRGDAARLELLRKVEDQTRLHVPQGEAFREFGHPLEPTGEGRKHPDRHVRPPLEELDERALRQEQQLRVGERLGVRGKDPPLEDHRLGERLTRFQDVENLLLPLPGELEHLHLAGRDDEEPLGAVPLPEDRLLLRESPGYGEVGDPSQVVVGQGGEQGRLPEGVHRPGGHATILMDRRAASRRDFRWRIRSAGEVGGWRRSVLSGWGSWASRCAGTSWRRATPSRCSTGRRRRWDRWSPRGRTPRRRLRTSSAAPTSRSRWSPTPPPCATSSPPKGAASWARWARGKRTST